MEAGEAVRRMGWFAVVAVAAAGSSVAASRFGCCRPRLRPPPTAIASQRELERAGREKERQNAAREKERERVSNEVRKKKLESEENSTYSFFQKSTKESFDDDAQGKEKTMELPDAVSLASHAAHADAGMCGLAYVSSGEGEGKALSLLTCGADGALSSRPVRDDADALLDATSISTGTSLTPLTCLAASRGVFAVGDENNYVRVRDCSRRERERERERKQEKERDFRFP